MPHAATALDVVASRMLNKDAPHQLRADGEKMRTILPLHPGVIHQSHIRFIDQSGCLEAVARTFTSHIAMGEAMELRVDDWCQLIKGALISLGPGLQQLCDNGRASLSVLRRPHRCWILLPLLNKGGKSDHSAPPSGTHRQVGRSVPNTVPERGPRTINRQPTSTKLPKENGPEIVNFRPALESPLALANRRLQPLGHLTADAKHT
jgi:hypothetical protein